MIGLGNQIKNFKVVEDIQVIRGIAVLSVVLFHIWPDVFGSGYLGVDVFFVVSGFVMAPRIAEIFQTGSSAEIIEKIIIFYRKRFWRLFPALAFTLTISSFMILLLTPLSFAGYSIKLGIAAIFGSANIFAYRFSGDYFSPKINAFLHTWSLSAEEQFYLMTPLLLFVMYLIMKRKLNLLISYVCFALISITFFVAPHLYTKSPIGDLVGNSSVFSFYSPLSRAWEFIVGLIIFEVGKHKSFSRKRRLVYAPALLLPISVIGFSQSTAINVGVCLLVCFILSNIDPYRIHECAFILKPFKTIGNMSYSIYLVHWPIIYLLMANEINIDFPLGVISLLAILSLSKIMKTRIEDRYRYGFYLQKS